MDRAISRTTQRLAVGCLFFLNGLCFSSWASRIPYIQEKLRLSDAELGIVLFAIPAGSFLSIPFCGWVTSIMGSRRVVLIATLVYASLIFSLGVAPNTATLIFFLFFLGIAGNTVNISVNTQAVAVETLYQRSIMASLHGLWSMGGFTGAILGTFMISKKIIPEYHFLFISTFTIIAALYTARYFVEKYSEKNSEERLFTFPKKSLLILGIMAFCGMISEGAMFDWSGIYFAKVVEAKNGWIGVGYSAFMGTMAIGRFMADSFTIRFGLRNTLQLSGFLIASGLFIAVTLPNLTCATLGFLMVGFGVSSVVPLVYGKAGKSPEMPPPLAITAVSTIGFMGFLIGPPLIGLVAGATSLRISFFLIGLMGMGVGLLSFKIKQ